MDATSWPGCGWTQIMRSWSLSSLYRSQPCCRLLRLHSSQSTSHFSTFLGHSTRRSGKARIAPNSTAVQLGVRLFISDGARQKNAPEWRPAGVYASHFRQHQHNARKPRCSFRTLLAAMLRRNNLFSTYFQSGMRSLNSGLLHVGQ